MTDRPPPSHLATAIAQAAGRDDPSLPVEVGYQLALSSLEELRANPQATPGALARRILTRHPDTDVSWANHVARQTLLLIARQ